jgi:hypothetical protein
VTAPIELLLESITASGFSLSATLDDEVEVNVFHVLREKMKVMADPETDPTKINDPHNDDPPDYNTNENASPSSTWAERMSKINYVWQLWVLIRAFFDCLYEYKRFQNV